jgi:hypothetical protein
MMLRISLTRTCVIGAVPIPSSLWLATDCPTLLSAPYNHGPCGCNPLDETTSHSTRPQKTATKSLVIPQAGEEANVKGMFICLP